MTVKGGKTSLKDSEVETLCSLEFIILIVGKFWHFSKSLYVLIVLDHHFSNQIMFLKYLI